MTSRRRRSASRLSTTARAFSLCALTRSYARRAADADALCEKLAQAAAGDKETWLKAYRNQVDAKTGSGPGKSFTAAQGALLKQLSTRL